MEERQWEGGMGGREGEETERGREREREKLHKGGRKGKEIKGMGRESVVWKTDIGRDGEGEDGKGAGGGGGEA